MNYYIIMDHELPMSLILIYNLCEETIKENTVEPRYN